MESAKPDDLAHRSKSRRAEQTSEETLPEAFTQALMDEIYNTEAHGDNEPAGSTVVQWYH